MLWLVLVLAALSPNRAPADGTIHSLLVVNSADRDLGAGFNKSAAMILQLFKDVNYPPPTILSGEKVNAREVSAALRQLAQRARADDTVFVYFACHGETSRGETPFATRHVIDLLNGETILRSKIHSELKAGGRPPRLLILLTDSCSSFMGAVPTRAYGAATAAKAVMNRLFLGHSGVVDITAASEGQYAWYVHGEGLFSSALNAGILNRKKEITWQQLFEDVQRRVKEAFDAANLSETPENKKNRQVTQTPHAFSLGEPGRTISIKPPALPWNRSRGFREIQVMFPLGVATERGSLKITRIDAGGQGQQAGLREGDVIWKVHGQRVQSMIALRRALREFGDKATILVAERCGCGCGKLHYQCGPGCKWMPGGPKMEVCARVEGREAEEAANMERIDDLLDMLQRPAAKPKP